MSVSIVRWASMGKRCRVGSVYLLHQLESCVWLSRPITRKIILSSSEPILGLPSRKILAKPGGCPNSHVDSMILTVCFSPTYLVDGIIIAGTLEDGVIYSDSRGEKCLAEDLAYWIRRCTLWLYHRTLPRTSQSMQVPIRQSIIAITALAHGSKLISQRGRLPPLAWLYPPVFLRIKPFMLARRVKGFIVPSIVG